MTVHPELLTEFQRASLPVQEQVALATLGSFQLGGPAASVVTVRSANEMALAQKILHGSTESAVLIGEGTNILFSDEGWNGILIRSVDALECPEASSPQKVRVPAALNLEKLVDWAIEHELSGLEPFVGIPGTVGGAVVGNAGAWGVQMADRLTLVSGWTPQGEAFTWRTDECGFEYRNSTLKEQGYWVSEVTFSLEAGDQGKLLSEKERVLAEREARHPEWRSTPCIGSFFKNLEPSSAAGRRRAAGWFLEEAGAKDCRVGGAAVFPKHANILIKKTQDCRASDVAELAAQIQKRVKEVHGIDLEREVRYLGSFPGESERDGFW